MQAKPMKERQLRKVAECVMCHQPFGLRGPLFWRVRLTRYAVDGAAVRRQDGLGALLGSSALASVMGTDEDMAKPVSGVVEAEVERWMGEAHDLLWNLAGCSTYAAGHGLDEGHDAEMARPALDDVRRLALSERALRAEVERLRALLKRWIEVRHQPARWEDLRDDTRAALGVADGE